MLKITVTMVYNFTIGSPIACTAPFIEVCCISIVGHKKVWFSCISYYIDTFMHDAVHSVWACVSLQYSAQGQKLSLLQCSGSFSTVTIRRKVKPA